MMLHYPPPAADCNAWGNCAPADPIAVIDPEKLIAHRHALIAQHREILEQQTLMLTGQTDIQRRWEAARENAVRTMLRGRKILEASERRIAGRLPVAERPEDAGAEDEDPEDD